jgi:hypothetical protein
VRRTSSTTIDGSAFSSGQRSKCVRIEFPDGGRTERTSQ